MNILSVIESFGHGGAETVLTDLVLGLGEHAHRVLHFSRANGVPIHTPFVEALAAAAVPCLDLHWSCLTHSDGRVEALGSFEPDVVLFHWWGNDPWLPWIDATLGHPSRKRPAFVCVLHHAAGIRPPSGYDRYVLVSPNQSRQVSHHPHERVVNIPNGVDLARFAAIGARQPSVDADRGEMVVGRLNNLNPPKIPSDWVRTLVRFDLPSTRFVIAGDGPVRRTLEDDARALTPPGRFRFPGYVPREEVPALLQTFDVFCYATADADECHPLALIEALAAGLPIVAEARGGIPSIVSHERNGLLAFSTAEIGAHLHRLRAEPAFRARLAAGALADASRFSLDTQLARYRSLLAEVISERQLASVPRRTPTSADAQGDPRPAGL